MGDLLDTAFSGRDKGGQPHRLPGVLRDLGPDDADKLRTILAASFTDVNWVALREEMYHRGFVYSVATWKRWSVDYKRDPERFGGSR